MRREIVSNIKKWYLKRSIQVHWMLGGGAVSTAVATSPLAVGTCKGSCMDCGSCGAALAFAFALPITGKVMNAVKRWENKEHTVPQITSTEISSEM